MGGKVRTAVFCAVALLLGAQLPVVADHPTEEEYGRRVWFFVGNGFEEGDLGDYFRRTIGCEVLRNQEGHPGNIVSIGTFGGTSRPFAVKAGGTYRLTLKVFNRGMKSPPVSPAGGLFPSALTFYRGGKAYPAAWETVKVYNFRNAAAELPQIVRTAPFPAAWTDVTVDFTVPAGSTMFDFTVPGGSATSGFGPFLLAGVSLTEVVP